MAQLDREEKTGLNITSEATLLTHTYEGAAPIEVIARVDLGDLLAPLSGNGGTYVIGFAINGIKVMPRSPVIVEAGLTRAIVVSRAVPIDPDDVVTVTVIGLAGETAVNTVTSLRDVTPAKISDIQGDGAISVDHNHGGTDQLAVKTAAGAGVDNMTIRAFLRSDYNDGNTSADYVRGESTTNAAGRWVRPMMLDAGQYTLLFFKQREFRPSIVHITVA